MVLSGVPEYLLRGWDMYSLDEGLNVLLIDIPQKGDVGGQGSAFV